MRRSPRLAAAVVGVALGTGQAVASDADTLHYIAIKGTDVLSANRPDDPVNPASVVKVGTSLWALDRYRADHRFTTTFGVAGTWDRASGVLRGDLVIEAGGDPDFQLENAFLVARELNRLGLRRIEGALRINGLFWIGWEQGVEKRETDPVKRGRTMGQRLVTAFNPAGWDRSIEATWQALCQRRGWDVVGRPAVVITGGVVVNAAADAMPLLEHRSNPLAVTLRRFNVYSNNDIIRIADGLGSVAELDAFVSSRLRAGDDDIVLATASGERSNRMSVRHMAALFGALAEEAAEQRLELRQLLPVIGCDPGSTRRMFPALARPPLVGTVTCKTGTLTATDGGVAVLAGTFTAADGGAVVFAIAAPGAGGRLQYWRQLEQRWVLSLMEEQRGAIPAACGEELPFSDSYAEIDVVLTDSRPPIP